MHNTRAAILLRFLRTAAGLSVFALGVYLTISANIGLAPWDAFSMGISYHAPLTYGQAHMLVSCAIVGVDFLLRERIGYGTLLDAVLVGAFVDLYDGLDLFPALTSLPLGLAAMAAGLVLMSLGQYLYMSAGLCCGPRDALLVGLGKRLPRLPIGAVNTALLCAVLLGGWLLGASIGVGTVVSTFGAGVAMQIVCRVLRFEPRAVRHQGIFEVTRALLGR